MQWVSGENNAIAAATPTELTGVIALANDSGYMSVSMPADLYNSTVDLTFSCSPTGPWSSATPVYTIPQIAEYHDETRVHSHVSPGAFKWGTDCLLQHRHHGWTVRSGQRRARVSAAVPPAKWVNPALLDSLEL